MYCVLMDKKTNSFYMDPKEIRFYAYSDIEEYNPFYKDGKESFEVHKMTFKQSKNVEKEVNGS